MQYRHIIGGPVVAVDGLSPREWMQAADVVVAQHRSRRSARRWAEAIQRSYPGCTLAISRHRSGRWCLVADPDGRIVVATAHSSHLPSMEALGINAFRMWALCQEQS